MSGDVQESLRLPAALHVLLQSPESLQVLPLQKAVLSHPERFHTGLGHTFVESRSGEATVLLNLANWVAVDGGSVRHLWRGSLERVVWPRRQCSPHIPIKV